MDITVDRDGNLQTGAGPDRYYIAQAEIPPIEYAEESWEAATETAGGEREPLPLDMSKVRLTLWGLDGLPAAIVAQLTTEDKEDEENG